MQRLAGLWYRAAPGQLHTAGQNNELVLVGGDYDEAKLHQRGKAKETHKTSNR